MKAALCLALVVIGATVSGAGLQEPAFDVASIKINNSNEAPNSIAIQPGGRLVARKITLRELVRIAYGLQDDQVAGGPEWITSSRFDITAKGEGPVLAMLRSLLAERFGLRTHLEARDLAVFELATNRSDRRLGPQLKPSQTDCAAVAPPAPSPGERQLCDAFTGGAPRFFAGGVSMKQLAANLSRQVRRVVVDRTGLTGLFDVELTWMPEGLPPRPYGAAPDQPIRINGTEIDPNAPTIFTALQEQLGLKLESTKASVDVRVVDRADQPTPD